MVVNDAMNSKSNKTPQKTKSGKQIYLIQKLWASDITDPKPPLSGAGKHPNF
jgi:hypothetical protein